MSGWSEPEIGEVLSVLTMNGIPADTWEILSRSNRLVLKLQPSGLIAKAMRLHDTVRLVNEFTVAAHVTVRNGPAVPPVPGTTVWLGQQVAVSLWEPMEVLAPASDAEACDAYLELRRCLDSYSGALPDFREAIFQAADFLNTKELQCLSGEDATRLRAFYTASFSHLSELRWMSRVLHGDPHAGNVARARQGLRWLEFESVCIGPVEWDLSALPGGTRALEHNPTLLNTLTRLRSACVVVWCAVKMHPNAAETNAIAHHMELIRTEAFE